MILVSTTPATYFHDPQAKLDYGLANLHRMARHRRDHHHRHRHPVRRRVPHTDPRHRRSGPGHHRGRQTGCRLGHSSHRGRVWPTCHIVTSAGREDDRTIYLNVRDR